MKKTSTTKEIIQRIYTQRGIGGLFAGLVPRVAKIGKSKLNIPFKLLNLYERIPFSYSARLCCDDILLRIREALF